jgi:amino acid adenylation domain-containing protein
MQPRFSPPPVPGPIDSLFARQAQLTPDRIALRYEATTISFADLQQRVAQAAGGLAAQGVEAGDVVGIHIARSIDWAVAVLAVLRAGAAAMPLPPDYPHAQLAEFVRRAAARCVVHCGAAPPLGVPTVELGTLASQASGAAMQQARSEDSARPAFVLCSSGSTGAPKMIVRSHRSFMHRLQWTWARHPFQDGDLGCHKASPTTTHGIYELLEPLLCGHPVLVVGDDQARELERFWTLLRRHAVTRLLIVPSALQSILDMEGLEPPPLKMMVLMGEPVTASLARRAVQSLPAATALYSIYGSTEASSTLVCDLRRALLRVGEIPLGEPITPHVQAKVLDDRLAPVAAGRTGRLYIGGPALFDGYLGQDALTAQVLRADPVSAERLYDTRDDVRVADEGQLTFVGRADDTVKIRGFRVELGEVESALAACPGVTRAAVVVGGGSAHEATLLGFYTPGELPASAVFNFLRARLAPHMVPARLLALDAFPLTERAKLDRRALAALAAADDGGADPGRFAGAVEQQVAHVWARTLGHSQFGPDSIFFEVGGTSLTTAVLVHRLRQAFALERDRLPELAATRNPTVASMARHLQGLAAGDAAEPPLEALPSDCLVTLRSSADAAQPPLFLIASAGGTLGAYQKLVAMLGKVGEVVGVRDPYVAGARDPAEGFDRWVDRYLQAIRSRQPAGPYRIAAYSSAGAFGIELAQRLRSAGAQVQLLALVDPLGIEAAHRTRFGWWVLRASHAGVALRSAVRAAGALRRLLAPLLRWRAARTEPAAGTLPAQPFDALRDEMLRSRGPILALAALMELNTGLRLDLSDLSLPAQPTDAALRALQARVAATMPEVDGATIERIAAQYALQLREQKAYALRPYDGATLLVEPVSPYAGLLAAQLAPHFTRLRSLRIDVGPQDGRVSAISRRFGAWRPHFVSMRDAAFCAALARALEQSLAAASAASPPAR